MKPLKPDHLFFGESPQSLFGCYHPPSMERECSHSILLCYPFGHEYIRVHRVFRRLAINLASNGFHVFRFDYFGTGDSSGDPEQARLRQWIENIYKASEQLQLRSKLSRVCLVGLRLGATMAVMAAKELPEMDALVLWEPVVNGSEYLRELAIEQYRFEESTLGCKIEIKCDSRNSIPNEILGFPISPLLLDDLRQVDLMTIPVHAKDIHVVLGTDTPEVNAYCELLGDGKRQISKDVINDQTIWIEEPYKSVVPVHTLNSIVNWIGNRLG
jgi:uncharacterized protein